MGLLTKDSIGVFHAEASSASVVQLSSGPMNAVTPASRICVIALETETETEAATSTATGKEQNYRWQLIQELFNVIVASE